MGKRTKILGASCGKVFEGRQAQRLKPQGGTQKVKPEKKITAGRPANQGKSEGSGNPAKINADTRYEGTNDRMTSYGGLLAIPSRRFWSNHAFFQIIMLAYNLWSWMRLLVTSAPARGLVKISIRRRQAASPKTKARPCQRIRELVLPPDMILDV